MTPIDPASNPHSETNEITRRTFMKKSALTVGAVTILGQGVGFAGTDGFPGTSGTNTTDTAKTVTVTVTMTRTRLQNESVNSQSVVNDFNQRWPDNKHGSGPGSSAAGSTLSPETITWQRIHTDARLESSNSVSSDRQTTLTGNTFTQTLTTTRTYVYKD